MVQIIDKRGTHKTKKLMEVARDTDGVIVSANSYALKQKAIGYGIFGIDFISYEDFIDYNYDTLKPIYIDDLEEFVKSYSGFHNLAGYTLTLED